MESPKCPRCNGEGFRPQENEDPLAVLRYRRCECWNEPVAVAERLAIYGLAAVEIESAFAPWIGDQPADVLRWKGDPWALFVLGPPGRGKTKACAMLAAAVARSGKPLRWINCAERVPQVELAMAEERLLILDDAGSGPDMVALGKVIEGRHRRQLPTLVNANATSPESLFSGDERLTSRLQGVLTVVFSGQDWRAG